MKKFLDQYLFGLIKGHMHNIYVADDAPTFPSSGYFYSWIEILFEYVAIFCLCLAPKGFYIILALLSLIINVPIGLSAAFLLVFRMPSNKSAFNDSHNFWYHKWTFKRRSIF